MFFQDLRGLLVSDPGIFVIVFHFPELDEFLFGHAVLEEEVVCVAVGLGHDGQIKICRGHGPATSEQHLGECSIECAF